MERWLEGWTDSIRGVGRCEGDGEVLIFGGSKNSQRALQTQTHLWLQDPNKATPQPSPAPGQWERGGGPMPRSGVAECEVTPCHPPPSREHGVVAKTLELHWVGGSTGPQPHPDPVETSGSPGNTKGQGWLAPPRWLPVMDGLWPPHCLRVPGVGSSVPHLVPGPHPGAWWNTEADASRFPTVFSEQMLPFWRCVLGTFTCTASLSQFSDL